MTPTTQKFGWKDRDTAARDLLQVVYHAPEPMSERALELLAAIRSPAIVPELLEIFRDENRWGKHRAGALKAIAFTSIDIQLPELQQYLPVEPDLIEWSNYMTNASLLFLSRHSGNQNWLSACQANQFAYIDTLQSIVQRQELNRFIYLYRDNQALRFPVLDRLMSLIETHPELLDLDTVIAMRFQDDRQSTQVWLSERWDTLIYLCLTIDAKPKSEFLDVRKVVSLLDDWLELKQRVFESCPSFIPEYETQKMEKEARRNKLHPPFDVTQSFVWQELAGYYRLAESGDHDARRQLNRRLIQASDGPEQSVAAHFLGKFIAQNSDPETRIWYINVFQEGSNGSSRYTDHWVKQDGFDPDHYSPYSPVRFELGDILRSYPQPNVWEALINAYFHVAWTHQQYFLDWIAYQTDVLSGLEVEYTGAILEVQDRPWFRALVERESANTTTTDS